MELLDFDKHFSDYTSAWMHENSGKYKNFDAMEAAMPDVYLKFLNTPAPWLDGITPGAYFTQYEDPKVLVDWMYAYFEKNIPVPDQLLDQIKYVGQPCEKRLLAVVKDDQALQDARMTAIGLLREMESTAPKALYIAWQVSREAKDELCDNALDSLRQMGAIVVKPMLDVLNRATPAGQEALLDILCNYPGNEKVFALTLNFFKQNTARRALFACYLGKLGDERALPALQEAAGESALAYLDFIEIRSAIERLGGEAPQRSYEADLGYEAMRRLQ